MYDIAVREKEAFMHKPMAVGVLAVSVMAVLLLLGGVTPAMAEATFADVLNIPHDVLSGPGAFIQKVINTPVGEPASHHHWRSSKPVMKMLWSAPQPTLSTDRMRSCCR